MNQWPAGLTMDMELYPEEISDVRQSKIGTGVEVLVQ